MTKEHGSRSNWRLEVLKTELRCLQSTYNNYSVKTSTIFLTVKLL